MFFLFNIFLIQYIVSKNFFQQTLIYSGISGDKINITYRESSGSIVNPSFSNNVEYDLSKSKIIGYKGCRLEVVKATNQSIKFKLLSNFIK